MNYKVSIIIPCYNGAEDVENCISSLQKSTYRNIEILLIDDGSTDDTAKICQKLAEEDCRIQYIYQENAGVSAARNTGLKRANGDYIIFCDSDDVMPNDSIEVLLEKVVKNDCDIASGVICFQKSNLKEICKRREERIIKDSQAIIQRCIDPVYDGVWGKIYKKQILNGIFFETGRKINEDVCFIFQCLTRCRKIVEINHITYRYLYHSGSASRTGFADKHYDILYFKDKKVNYLKQYFPNLKKLRAAVALRSLISFFIKFVRSNATKKEKRQVRKEIWANRAGFSLCSKREKILFLAITFFYPIFYWKYNKGIRHAKQ